MSTWSTYFVLHILLSLNYPLRRTDLTATIVGKALVPVHGGTQENSPAEWSKCQTSHLPTQGDISSAPYSDTAKTSLFRPRTRIISSQAASFVALCGCGMGSETVGSVVLVPSRCFIKDSKRLIEEVCCTA
jgi:hypothetical protein